MITTDLSNEEYRKIPKDSASFLKAVLRSVAHALTEKKRTKAMNEGLRIHEYVLERHVFEKNYRCGINPDDYPDAINTADELKQAIKEFNETRLPALKKTGSRDALLEQITKESPHHLEHVSDFSALNVSDIKAKIDEINSSPNRGLIPLSGSSIELYERAVDAGWSGEYLPYIIKQDELTEDRKTLPYAEYSKYDAMYQSLLKHVETGAQAEIERNQGEVVMQWLHYALTSPEVMETEVSIEGENDKCRLDMRFKAGDKWMAFDLKSSEDARPEAFIRAAGNMHYDLQAAHYNAVCEEVGQPNEVFAFIAIETKDPYGVNIFIPDDEFMEIGHKKRNFAKKRLTQYKESGIIAAYEPKATVLIPSYSSKNGEWNE